MKKGGDLLDRLKRAKETHLYLLRLYPNSVTALKPAYRQTILHQE
jgi:hypothetical protein